MKTESIKAGINRYGVFFYQPLEVSLMGGEKIINHYSCVTHSTKFFHTTTIYCGKEKVSSATSYDDSNESFHKAMDRLGKKIINNYKKQNHD